MVFQGVQIRSGPPVTSSMINEPLAQLPHRQEWLMVCRPVDQVVTVLSGAENARCGSAARRERTGRKRGEVLSLLCL